MTPNPAQPDDEQRVAEFRALREEAWRMVRADLTRLQKDLEDRGIGDRIRDRIGEEAHEVWDYTLDVASEHRGVVAATLAALVAWVLRGPIGSGIGAILGTHEEPEPRESVESDEGDET